MLQSITGWRSRLEPKLIEKLDASHESAVGATQSGHARSRHADRNSNRAEEPGKMVERADNFGIPAKQSPAVGNKMPPPAPNLPRPGSVGANGSGSPQHTTEGSAGARGNEVDRRTLIIGQGIALTGEVNSCDRLVIIAETGVFNGHASTENADVRGRFDGDLVVRKRLLIRAGGHVSGTVTYGEIEIEAGGGISGTIEQAGASNADLLSLSA
jgi:cytoskeletal protein CcmA (bactofilin family)